VTASQCKTHQHVRCQRVSSLSHARAVMCTLCLTISCATSDDVHALSYSLTCDQRCARHHSPHRRTGLCALRLKKKRKNQSFNSFFVVKNKLLIFFSEHQKSVLRDKLGVRGMTNMSAHLEIGTEKRLNLLATNARLPRRALLTTPKPVCSQNKFANGHSPPRHTRQIKRLNL